MTRKRRRELEIVEERRLRIPTAAERAVLAACILPESRNDPRDPLGELRALAETAGATVVGEVVQNRRRPEASMYIGKGKVDEIRTLADELGANLVVFDNDLSPAQIRNIEETIKRKVLDRSSLILDIFASRATTTAARLQVELAQLEYTYPRLKAMWSHLEKIAGGAPVGIGTRGPGETQIETDRRLVQARKTVLKRRIAEIHNRRLREVAERKREHFTACLVGYTNAGKSTLFNTLTAPSGGGGAYADNRLFATLTTRTRLWLLGGGEQVMLSDTVGFVRDLPHHLVASFRATLEEAIHADLLLIVIDASDPQAEQQLEVVTETLADIGVGAPPPAKARSTAPPGAEFLTVAPPDSPVQPLSADAALRTTSKHPSDQRQLLVLNKVDCVDDRSFLAHWLSGSEQAVAVSAVTGEGLTELASKVREIARGSLQCVSVLAPLQTGKAIAILETRGHVIQRDYEPGAVRYLVRIGSVHLPTLRSLGCSVTTASNVPT